MAIWHKWSWCGQSLVCFWLALGALFLSSGASAQIDCWVPTREVDAAKKRGPETEPLRQAFLVVDKMFKNNSYYKTMPDVRMRNTISISLYDLPRYGRINSFGSSKEVWVPGKCELDQHADRAFIRTGISVSFNVPDAVLTQEAFRENNIRTFYEPRLTAKVGGYPEFDNVNVMIAEGGKLPWAPFTVGDYLDMQEVRLQKRIAEHEKDKTSPPRPIDESKAKQTYEDFKKVNPKMAEDFRKNMDAMMKEQATTMQKWTKQMDDGDAELGKESTDLKAFRASFTPQQLASQASTGSGPYGLAKSGDKNARPLVKVNLAFGWDKAHNGRIQLIVVSGSIKRTDPPTPVNTIVRKSIESLDYPVLASLLR